MTPSSSIGQHTLTRRAALALGPGVAASAAVGTAPASAATVLTYEYKRQNTQSWCSAAGTGHRYVFRIAPTGELKTRLRIRVHESIDRGYPVVINMNQVAGDTYSAGHYIAIVGYRADGYRIADPDEPTRNGVWFTEDQIVAWNKLNTFTAFS